MLRRKKKNTAAPSDDAETAAVDTPTDPMIGSTDAETADPETAEPVSAQADRVEETEAKVEPGRAAIAFAETPARVEQDTSPADYNADSAEAVLRHRRYGPNDAIVAGASGGEEHLSTSYWVGGVKEVLTKSGTSSAEERERQAAADFQAAIMPGLMGLRDAVPDAATPDDALRILAEREAEHSYPEDPEAGQSDIFRSDASVYYRIRKRFDKPPRRVGWDNPWRPPPGLARPDPPRRALDRGK